MKSIRVTQTRKALWECVLCKEKCAMTEADFTSFKLTYACSCGKVYTILFGETVTVKEDDSLETIFTIKRYPLGVEVRLAWDQEKGRYASLGTYDADPDWQAAIDRAIGYCWRTYGSEIIAHIQHMDDTAKEV